MIRSMMLVCALLFLAPVALAVEVQLQVTEIDQVARTPAVVTTGVPFARGAVADVGRLTVSVAGEPVPAQFIKTVPWDDGSVRWALMDVQLEVPGGGEVELLVTDAANNPAPANPVVVNDGDDAVRVSTGPLQLVVNKESFNLFRSLTVDGNELLGEDGRGLVVYKEEGGEVRAGAPSEVVIEQAGPMRAIVRASGRFPDVHDGLLGYTVRITAYAGQKFVKVHAWLENHGAMGYDRDENRAGQNMEWFAFDGMAVEFDLGLGDTVKAACEGAEAENRLKVLQVCNRGDASPYFTWDDFEYTITSGDEELEKGARTDGVVTLSGDAGALTTAIRDFWENYEKAIELDDGTLKLWLWPRGGQWPRPHPNVRSRSYFDNNLRDLPRDDTYFLPGSVHKGHEFILDFSGRDAAETSAELSKPLLALASAAYYAETEAAPGLFAPATVGARDREANFKLASWRRMAENASDPESENSLYRARQMSFESTINYHGDSTYSFGWMDFGDISVPGFGPSDLEYDWTWIMLVNALRLGDIHSIRLGTSMARHRIDVDQFWSDRDPSYVNRLQRGTRNSFPSMHAYRLRNPPNISRNWIAGVVLYHMLTGEPKALECALRNAEGVRAAWADGGGPRRNAETVAWSVSSMLAINALTGDEQWKTEALDLFKETMVPAPRGGRGDRDPFVGGGRQFCFAIAQICELHHRTGDEDVLRFITDAARAEFPIHTFFEATLYLADLYAYAGYQAEDDELLDKAEKAFAAAFPESRRPPVFLPNSSTWARESAMTLRTGHVLQFVNWKLNRGR